MHIQFLNGGLANQVFQYIFVRYAENYLNNGERWFLDDSFFFVNNVHNGYELKKVFGIEANLLSNYFDADVWNLMIKNKRENNISIPQQLKNYGMEIDMLTESPTAFEMNPFDGLIYIIECNKFHPQITKLPGNVYYHGYWVNNNWLNGYKDIIKNELKFPEITEKNNIDYSNMIKNTNSTCVHVRRGDYINLGWILEKDLYKNSIKTVLNIESDITLFVFSDDIEYCKQNADELGFLLPQKTIFIEGNKGENAYRDMQLMSMCRNTIVSNSAFSYLASLLNNDIHIGISMSPIREL